MGLGAARATLRSGSLLAVLNKASRDGEESVLAASAGRGSPPSPPKRTMATPQAAGEVCPICHEELRLEDAVRPHGPPLGGGCLFHENCLRPWLARRASCPTCRRPSRGPVRNPIFSRCARFRALAGRKLVILASLLGTIVLASCASLGTLLVVAPAPRTATVVGQNMGRRERFERRDFEKALELYDASLNKKDRAVSRCWGGTCLVRRGRFLCDSEQLSRCRPIDAPAKPPADRPTKDFDLVVIASVIIICVCVVYIRQNWQELLSQYESMVVDVNQEATRIVRQEGQNAEQEAANNANQALAARTAVILEGARRAVQETEATAAGATDRHAAGEAAARAEVCGLRSRNQTLESQLKTSGAENEVLAARVEEEAAARVAAEANARREATAREAEKKAAEERHTKSLIAHSALKRQQKKETAARAAAEDQAAETERRRAELATRVEALRREAEQATAALAAEIERRTEPPAEQDENVPSPPKVKRSFSFRVSFPRSFSVTSARSSREERPSRSFSTPMYDSDDDGPTIYGI